MFTSRPNLSPRRRPMRVKSTGVLLAAGALLLLSDTSISAQVRDTVRVDSTYAARIYELSGITVSVARPAITTGGSSAVEAFLDSLPTPPAPTLEEVLRGMPLLVVRRNSRGEAQPSLRGSEERQIGILVDGIPITLGWDHRSDLSVVPMTAAQGVRVVRGMSSVLYGPNVIGGALEIDVARSSRRSSVNPVELSLGRDHLGGTSASLGVGRIFGEDRSTGVVLRAGAGFRDSPGASLPGDLAVELRDRYLSNAEGLRLNSDSRRADAYLAARFRNETGFWVSLFSSAYDVAQGVAPESHQDNPRLWRYPDKRRLINAFSVGTGTVRTPWGTGDLEVSVGADIGSALIESFASERFETVEETETMEDFTFTARIEADHSLAGRGDLRTAFTYADVNHEEVLGPGPAQSYRQRLWSLAAETEWQLRRHGYTRISLGAALDGADTPLSGDDMPSIGSLSAYGVRIGLSSLVGDGVLAHAAASSRARFPSLRELYSGALGRFLPNPDLSSERLWGAEGGFTLHTGKFELQTVAFHQRLADGIGRTSVQVGDLRLFQRVNRDEIVSTGAEFLVSGQVGSLSLTGDLTLQRVRGKEDDEAIELEYEPSVLGRMGASLPVPGGVDATASTRWVGSQSCENPEIDGLQPVAASAVSDFSVRRGFTVGESSLGRMEAVLSLRNLTDATAFDQCGLPQPGRTLELHLKLW